MMGSVFIFLFHLSKHFTLFIIRCSLACFPRGTQCVWFQFSSPSSKKQVLRRRWWWPDGGLSSLKLKFKICAVVSSVITQRWFSVLLFIDVLYCRCYFFYVFYVVVYASPFYLLGNICIHISVCAKFTQTVTKTELRGGGIGVTSVFSVFLFVFQPPACTLRENMFESTVTHLPSKK